MSPYSQYSVHTIWNSLADEDTGQIDPVIRSWANTATALDQYRLALTAECENLFAAWKPNPGSAAESFKTFVGTFLETLDQTAAQASRNYRAINVITTAVLESKTKVKAAHDAMLSLGLDPSDTTMAVAASPYWIYSRQATGAMEAADQAISEANAILTKPIPFSVGEYKAEPAASLKPIGSSSSGFSSGFTSVPVVAASTIAPLVTTPPPSTSGTTATNPGSGGALSGSTLTGSGTALPGGNAVPGAGQAWTTGQPSAHTTSGGMRVMPYGAVIGETRPVTERSAATGSSARRSGTASERAASGQRVGTSSGATGRAGRTTSGTQGRVLPGQSGSRRRSRDENGQPIWDRDTPWEIEQGVPPVLEAPPEPTRHDPGPGVIGIDR